MTGLPSPLGFHDVETPRISKGSENKYGKVVSCKHRPPLPRRRDPLYAFLLDAESNPVKQCDQKD